MSQDDVAGTWRARPSFKGRKPTSRAVSRTMQGNRKKDTKHELALRKTLWHRGYRYRLHSNDLPGNPDIAFPRERVAVFVDGDFWHGRDWEARSTKLREGSNSGYWLSKIQRNRERDVEPSQKLRHAGWTVIRLWETDVLKDPEGAAHVVARALPGDGTLTLDEVRNHPVPIRGSPLAGGASQ
ncbi:MAG: very short patch repair endonuclease [Dehalococcoidia bacterium]